MADSSDSESVGSAQEHALVEYRGDGTDNGADHVSEEIVTEDAAGSEAEGAVFDPVLATQHSYLGRGAEVHGRTWMDEDSVLELPLHYTPAVMLLPGQTLPLSIFHPATIAMIHRVVKHNRTFGLINKKCVQAPGSKLPTVGTTAEIYEMNEDSAEQAGFAVKAKGRQRFKVLSTRSLVDGTKVGVVQILADELGFSPFRWCRPPSLWRLRLRAPPQRTDTHAAGGHRLIQVAAPKSGGRRRLARQLAAVAPWPAWVYAQYDLQQVAERVRAAVQRCLLCRPDSVPAEPTQLSFWVAMSLPLDDDTRAQLLLVETRRVLTCPPVHRAQLLRLNSVVRRLRLEISIMQTFKVLACAECEEPVGSADDVFSMSAEGPQNIYVSPHGHLHETLTLYKASGLHCITRPSEEFSWFPGYAWEIAQCSFCSSHMGWRFTCARRGLKPASFWGLCRRSLLVRSGRASVADVLRPPVL